MEDVGICYGHLVYVFYGHLVYFIAIWSILLPFGIFCSHLVDFMVLWYIFPLLACCTKKNLATLHSVFFNLRLGSML
jgi:hypothetical protein